MSARGSLLALAALLLWSSAATAGLVGVTAERVNDPLADGAGLAVWDIVVEFDDPADRLLGVVFSDLTSSTGAFYQHPAGGDTAPTSAAVAGDPLVAFDSFVTVGVAIDDGTDMTGLSPVFDGALFGTGGRVAGDWFNAEPDNGQGSGSSVRIARLTLQSVGEGDSVTGTLSVGWKREGTPDFVTTPVQIAFGCALMATTPELLLNRSGADVEVSWAAVPLAISYDLVRGDLGALRSSGGNFTTATSECLADGETDTTVVYQTNLAPGEADWVLGRAISCGVGTYDASDPSQSGGPRDAEIEAASPACP